MNSVIICEGDTDLTLIQYFMEKVNGWNYLSNKKTFFKNAKNFNKAENKLKIGATGGCDAIKKCFEKTIETNINSAYEDESFNNIVIISDRDEANTVDDFEKQINDVLNNRAINNLKLVNNEWVECSIINAKEQVFDFKILLLIIPFEDTGALETFLLNALSDNDAYDKVIIDKGNSYVDGIDPNERYLSKRRYKTKAKFDVYFSIRTSVEQFGERRDILKGIKWEEYEVIQESFKKLKELG